jgi:hypothetical protein
MRLGGLFGRRSRPHPCFILNRRLWALYWPLLRLSLAHLARLFPVAVCFRGEVSTFFAGMTPPPLFCDDERRFVYERLMGCTCGFGGATPLVNNLLVLPSFAPSHERPAKGLPTGHGRWRSPPTASARSFACPNPPPRPASFPCRPLGGMRRLMRRARIIRGVGYWTEIRWVSPLTRTAKSVFDRDSGLSGPCMDRW